MYWYDIQAYYIFLICIVLAIFNPIKASYDLPDKKTEWGMFWKLLSYVRGEKSSCHCELKS